MNCFSIQERRGKGKLRNGFNSSEKRKLREKDLLSILRPGWLQGMRKTREGVRGEKKGGESSVQTGGVTNDRRVTQSEVKQMLVPTTILKANLVERPMEKGYAPREGLEKGKP